MRSISTILFLCAVCFHCRAQTAVTAIFTHAINATTATSYTATGATGNAPSGFNTNTYTYNFGTNVSATGNNHVLDSFTSFTENFHYVPVTPTVVFRRVNNAIVTGIRKSMWYYQDGTATINPNGTAPLYPNYDDSVERVFTERLFDIGIDNVFQNAITTNNNDIERMDVIFPTGVSVSDNTKTGFVVFDRGLGGSHDPFYIAAIKTLDATGTPSAYYNAVSAPAADYGFNIGSSIPYLILRENPTDGGHLLMMDNSTAQNRDGIFFRFTDLTVPSNSIIYGYSLFGPDVNVTPATNLVTYTNATNFPTTSDLSGGGLDPVAITGLWATNAGIITLSEWLESFQANWTNQQVLLSWQLASVNGLADVRVERSANGVDFSPLLYQPDPSTEPETATDPAPLPGANYYRLALLNKEGGVITYSTVSPVIVPGAALSFNLYPNPVRGGQFTLYAQGAYTLRLFDLGGRLAFSKAVNCSGNTSVGLPTGLARGAYAFQLTDKTGNNVWKKMIILE